MTVECFFVPNMHLCDPWNFFKIRAQALGFASLSSCFKSGFGTLSASLSGHFAAHH
jgi:hypothetical protein